MWVTTAVTECKSQRSYAWRSYASSSYVVSAVQQLQLLSNSVRHLLSSSSTAVTQCRTVVVDSPTTVSHSVHSVSQLSDACPTVNCNCQRLERCVSRAWQCWDACIDSDLQEWSLLSPRWKSPRDTQLLFVGEQLSTRSFQITREFVWQLLKLLFLCEQLWLLAFQPCRHFKLWFRVRCWQLLIW